MWSVKDLKIVDDKAGIKAEPLRLLATKAKQTFLKQNFNYRSFAHIKMRPVSAHDQFSWICYLPHILGYETAFHGLLDGLLFLGHEFQYLPSSLDDLYATEVFISDIDELMNYSVFLLDLDQESEKEKTKAKIQEFLTLVIAQAKAWLAKTLPANSQYLLGAKMTIADFALMGLYYATAEEKGLEALITKPLEAVTSINSYLTHATQENLSVLLEKGYHVTCSGKSSLTTAYKLLMSRAKLGYNIQESKRFNLKVANIKIEKSKVALDMVANALGFMPAEAGLSRENEIISMKDIAFDELLKIPNVSIKNLIKINHYINKIGNKGLLMGKNASVEEIYCVALYEELYKSEKGRRLCREYMPNVGHYAREWSLKFCRKEKAVLLISQLGFTKEPHDAEQFIALSTDFPLDQPQYLKNIGYKSVDLYILTLSNLTSELTELLKRDDIQAGGSADLYNLCDGVEDGDGLPGCSVSKFLDEHNVKYAGASYISIFLSGRKDLAKKGFVETGVSTSPYIIVDKNNKDQIPSMSHMKFPVFIKPVDGFGSSTLPWDSKCLTESDFNRVIKGRMQKYPDKKFIVESFIDGKEFTVMVVGNYDTEVNAFKPIWRAFQSHIPKSQQWISDDLLHSTAGAYPITNTLVEDKELANKLCDVAKRAFISIKGKGVARVDIRQNEKTGEVFVLEVNLPPAIGFQMASYAIARGEGLGLEDVFAELAYIGKV